MPGFLTKARQETGADKPKFGGGGSWLDIDAMVAREVVFGITNIEADDENQYNGTPRPRWILDIIPWYEGDLLPGAAQDERGRPVMLEAGRIGLAYHQSRDPLMNQLADTLDELSDEATDEIGAAVLVKIRVPGGKGGKYTDLCEWDEEKNCPILSEGTEAAPDEEDEPRRPSGRQAPARGGRQQQGGRQRQQAQAEPEPENEPDPPARGRGRTRSNGGSEAATTTGSARSGGRSSGSTGSSGGFAGASGAESDGQQAVPALAGDVVSAADLKLVSDVVGGDPYTESELAEEYDLPEGKAFPAIKVWLSDHGIDDYPPGRGKIKPRYRDAYSIALRCWMDATGRNADGSPYEGEAASQVTDAASATSPNPAVREGRVTPSGAEHVRQRKVREAAVPENAHEADQRMRPEAAPVRPEDKQAWMPPDQRERGPQPASEHVYEPNDVGDSIDPCPGCGVVVTGRAYPNGAGSYGIVHECPTSGHPMPLQAHNIRKG